MRKTNHQSLGEVIEQLKKTYNKSGKLDEIDLNQNWEPLMGKLIANHTQEIKLSRKKLILRIDSAPLREELSYSKERIITLLNEHLGKDLIKELIIR